MTPGLFCEAVFIFYDALLKLRKPFVCLHGDEPSTCESRFMADCSTPTLKQSAILSRSASSQRSGLIRFSSFESSAAQPFHIVLKRCVIQTQGFTVLFKHKVLPCYSNTGFECVFRTFPAVRFYLRLRLLIRIQGQGLPGEVRSCTTGPLETGELLCDQQT
jgi:hypothetical protein